MGFKIFVRGFHFLGSVSICSYSRAATKEFDDLSAKSREAEKEVNMLEMRVQEVNNNLSKHRKDMDCKYFIFQGHRTLHDDIYVCA